MRLLSIILSTRAALALLGVGLAANLLLRDSGLVSPSLMIEVLLLALLIPPLYWLTPKPWRVRLLLGVSILTLLHGGVSIEYVALLAILLCLTWITIAPPPMEPARLLSSRQLWGGLAAISLFAILLAGQRYLSGIALPAPLIVAALLGGIGVIAGLMLSEPRLWRPLTHSLIPLGLIAAVSIGFAPSLASADFTALFVTLAAMSIPTLSCCLLCGVWALRADEGQRRHIARVGIALLIVLFVMFKWQSNTDVLSWFGFSYIAFRLLHVLLEKRLNAALPVGTFEEWSVYNLFFSAQAVGPIDRWPRFAPDLQKDKRFSWEDFVTAWERILWGAIKKFFIADVLLLPLIPGSVPIEMTTPLYAWYQLYVYTFYLYWDFSGFVDIAIGIGLLMGVHLPENFNRPYTRGSLAQFWQSWHMTLSSWLRTYVFLPLSRSLLRTRLRRFPWLIVLTANLVTMTLIGFWHGTNGRFIAWGLWHALGLFVHKLFSDRTRRLQMTWKNTWRAQAFHVFSVALTFHFVVLGWVFFALPGLKDSLRYLALLFGVRL